jgi:uncharacterized protein (TIGR00730 family)
MMSALCVFCGARSGTRAVYTEAAVALADALVERDVTLIYGGGSLGLMGVMADRVLARGGRAIGVAPRRLFRQEVVHQGLTELHMVESLGVRKDRMIALADAFVALPGGLGTSDELFEVLSWAQLGLHDKPCGVLNVEGYFDALLAFADHMQAEGFLRPEHRALLLAERRVDALLDRLSAGL